MKKLITTIFASMLLLVSAFAQKEFKKLYEIKFPVSVDKWASNEEETLVFAGDKSEFCGVDAVTGKVLWQVNVKELFGVKKVDKWYYEEDLGAIVVEIEKKKDVVETTYLDQMTGKKMGEPTKRKEEKYRTTGLGWSGMFESEWTGKGDIYLEELGLSLELSYESLAINGSIQRNKKFPINVRCSGNKSWSTTVQGTFVRSLCDNVVGFGDNFGGDFITMFYDAGYVFVVYEGLSVIDVKTGTLVWETTFDYSIFDFGVFKSELIVGRAPMPVCDGSAVYVADLSKDVRAIKKFDLATGNVLWTSERLKKDAIITEMVVESGALIVKNGGEVLVQSYIQNANTGAETCISEWKEEGDFSLAAYDTQTGKELWVGDDMKNLGDKFKSISNLLDENGILYVASDRNLFALDPKSASMKFKVDVADMKIGKPKEIIFLENDIFISAEEGLARVEKATGKVIYSTNTDKNLGAFVRGEVFYLWVGKKPEEINEIIRFNIETGAIEGKIEDTPHPYFSPDGNEFIKVKDNVLARYRTKG
ncbi:MAG: hypothetical protein RL204_2423 [Bacteroidota bacterium]|jgi:outer membrane protein assembly factor BamB